MNSGTLISLCRALVVALVLLRFFDGAPVQGAGVGQRFSLSARLGLATNQAAQVFVPDYFVAPTNGRFMLLFHLHGVTGRAEDIVYKPRANAIVFNLQLNGLSGVYQTYFSDPAKFSSLTNIIVETLLTNGVVANPQIETLVLSSFSAGYAGLREILKLPSQFQRTDAILMGDSLYSSSDPSTRMTQLRDFLQFAADARDWRKFFLLTHSTVDTSGYDSTVETADYLVSGIERGWAAVSAVDEIGTQYRQCLAGHFQVTGYLETDHGKHYQHMNLMMARLLEWMASTNPVPEFELSFLSMMKLPADELRLELSAQRGREYVVERSGDLAGWVPLSIIAAQTNRVILQDAMVPGENRFYRAREAVVQTITQFEGYSSGTTVLFQPPSYSGSTSGYLESGATTLSRVTDVFPVGVMGHYRVLQVDWHFKSNQVNPWLRLTTINTPNVPNPTIFFTGALRFDVYSTRDIYVALGVRETDTTAPVGSNGGASGAIEWVGGTTQNSAPPLGRFVPADTWTRLVFFIPHEPVGNFAGNGVLNSTSGKGTLEHLAIVPASGSGAHTLYLDNFQVVE